MSLTNNTISSLKTFRYWCYKVLPLVYDDSLSYYEVLCKVVDYINNLIEADRVISDELEELKNELTVVQSWIDNFDTTYAEKIIEEHIATMIFIELDNSGNMIINIPESWNDIQFATTGLDIVVPLEQEFGHLVIMY